MHVPVGIFSSLPHDVFSFSGHTPSAETRALCRSRQNGRAPDRHKTVRAELSRVRRVTVTAMTRDSLFLGHSSIKTNRRNSVSPGPYFAATLKAAGLPKMAPPTMSSPCCTGKAKSLWSRQRSNASNAQPRSPAVCRKTRTDRTQMLGAERSESNRCRHEGYQAAKFTVGILLIQATQFVRWLPS